MFNVEIPTTSIRQLGELISQATQVTITAHMSPDGDAIGSSLALAHVLQSMGKNARVIVPDDYTKQLAFLPGTKDIIIYCRNTRMASDYIRNSNLICCLDYNEPKRIDRLMPAIVEAKAPKVMIDHHLQPSDFCQLVISYPELSSTCLLLLIVLDSLGLYDTMSVDAATCLMAGMMTDTGNLSYNSNDPDLYRGMAMLVDKGVDHDLLSRRLFDTFSESHLKINGYAISQKLKVWKEYGAALITLSRDELNRYHYSKGDTEGLVNKPLAIPGVVYSIYLREEERYIKVSMRSRGTFPCDQICAQYFNGGGHLNAAGGEFYGTMAQAVQVVERLLAPNKEKYINK